MIDKLKVFRYIIAIFIVLYICFSFIANDFNFTNWDGFARFFLIVLGIIFCSVLFISNNEIGFLNKKNIVEEIPKVKKYVGELKEELALIQEAYDLEKRIDDFRIRNKK